MNVVETISSPNQETQRSPQQDVQAALERLSGYLLGLQSPVGYWCAELECDVTPTADYILLQHFLRRNSETPQAIARDTRVIKAARRVLALQNEDGGWPVYHGGPGDISATVKAYFALKLAGFLVDDERLRSAAQFIRTHGGVTATNSFLKFYLALFGQLPWTHVPAMPPELALLPSSFPFSIHAISSWSRAIMIPMCIIYALKPRLTLPSEMGIAELTSWYGRGVAPKPQPNQDSWAKFFYRADFLLKVMEKNPIKPWRKKALVRCRDWILERLPKGQGLGSIWPAMINAHMALSCLEFKGKEQVLAESLREIDALILEDDQSLRIQPCFPPVWDTAIAIQALRAAGLPADDIRLKKAGDWLISKQVLHAGDWKEGNPEGKPGGWYFQFKNDFYPDTDDTAMVLLALQQVDLGPAKDAAVSRAVQWLLSMQNSDGGWGAFDKNNDSAFLTKVPFADHNAMIDPSTCDVTARILEAFGMLGGVSQDVALRAFAYLRRHQEHDGPWFGRWGVNYIYGTWSVSNAYRAWSGSRTRLELAPALEWLKSCQNADGGWGESCASYDDPTLKGKGRSTASQTAWALNAFFNAGIFSDAAVQRGIAYLARAIGPSGAVTEPECTGTGFPSVFYLNYHIYRIGFPMIALGRYLDHFASH